MNLVIFNGTLRSTQLFIGTMIGFLSTYLAMEPMISSDFNPIMPYSDKHFEEQVLFLNHSSPLSNPIQSCPTCQLIAAIENAEKAAEKSRSTGLVCDLASSFLVYKKLTANGLKTDGKYFLGYPVVGRQGRMQTSGSCLYSSESDKSVSCAWDPRIGGLSFFESTAIFSPTKFRQFVRDVKRLRDANPDNFCGVDAYNGFLIRFVKKSDAYLGQPEDSIVVDFNYFRSDEGLTPRLNEDVWEEVEQMAFFKYGARPHWGKNRKVAFLGVDKKFPRFREFVEARKVLDPDGMFSSETSDEIVFGREGLKEDGCALEGLCVCEEDRHCSPRNGYFCRRGLVYEEARVCRFSSNTTSIS